jgi:hypothetical protein
MVEITTVLGAQCLLQSESNHNFMPVINNKFDLATDVSVAKEPSKDHGFPTPPSEMIMTEPGPEFFTPARREKRRKLLELTKASFPDRMPLLYTPIVVKSTETERPPLVRAPTPTTPKDLTK